MTIFALASAHGSPGVTTSVMLLAAGWRAATGRDVLVVEADPDGGVLAARFDELRADRTLTDVAVDVRRGFDLERVRSSARSVWGGVAVVAAPPSAEQTQCALTTAGDRLAAGLAAADVDVLIDLGRLTSRSPALSLARRGVVTVMVSPPTFEAVAALRARVPELRSQGCHVGLVTVGDRPYDPVEVASAAGAPLLGVLPSDPRAAEPFAGGHGNDRWVRRSLLWRAAGDLASRLVLRVPPANEDIVDPARTDRPNANQSAVEETPMVTTLDTTSTDT